MSRKLYLDTNFYLDYFLDRKDNLKPLGLYASKLYSEAVSCRFQVLISEIVVEELCKVLKISESLVWEKILGGLKAREKISQICFNEEAKQNAGFFSEKFNLPAVDSVHLALASGNNAILVTRDRHFDCLKDSFKIQAPEELVFQ